MLSTYLVPGFMGKTPNSILLVTRQILLEILFYKGEPGGFPGSTVIKNPPANAGDSRNSGSIPGRSHRGGNGSPLQYSCLGNPMDRRAWRATIHGVPRSQIRLSTQTEAQLKDFIPRHAIKKCLSQNSNPGSPAFKSHIHNCPTAGTGAHS